MIVTWKPSWKDFVPFLDFPIELRQVACTTNSIESRTRDFAKRSGHRGHFPTEQAALKGLYLVATEKRKNCSNPDRPAGSTVGSRS